MAFNNLLVQEIVLLLQSGVISDSEEIVSAYDAILHKLGFNNEIIDLNYFEKLSSVVEAIQNVPLPPQLFTPGVASTSVACPLMDTIISNFDAPEPSQQTFTPGVASTSTARPVIDSMSSSFLSTVSRAERLDRQLFAPQVGCGNQFKYFNVLSEGIKFMKKFKVEGRALNFNFKHVNEEENPITWLRNAFAEIITYITKDANPHDRIGMTLKNQNYPEKPIGISYRRVDQMSVDTAMVILEKILQSNARFFASDIMELTVNRVQLPVGYGRGRLRLTGVSFEEYCRRKTGILQIVNQDNRCLAVALLAAIAHGRNDDRLHLYLRGAPCIDGEIDEFCMRAEVDLSNGGTREHIEQFQMFLTEYTIIVYNNRRGNSVYYEGPRSHNRKVLSLIMENEHYNVITNLTSAFACKYYCELCRTRCNSKAEHRYCKYTCPCCHSNPPCQSNQNKITCNDCNRDFRGEVCFAEHVKKLCKILRRCQTCLNSVWLNRKENHKCGYKFCTVCKDEKPVRHLCYMPKEKPNSKRKLSKNFIFVFYDFECMQSTSYKNRPNTYLHEPNLCVAQNVCNLCIDNDNIEQDCSRCGVRQHVFRDDPVNTLLAYISRLGGKNDNVVALAHNMKGYDGSFILQTVMKEEEKWNPKIISNGTKIMSLKCNNIKFIDSLNFMPLPLNKLPKTFKFPGCKGYFPHLFNTPENQNYIGPLPAAYYYMADTMSSTARSEFYVWYNSQVGNNVVFNFQDDIIKYCKDDVNILRKACLEFWKGYVASNNVDPFREACTIAGCTSLVYRRNFLKANTISILPHGGYRMADRQSTVAIKWLLWLEYFENIQIQHAGNNREVRLREGILVDGFCVDTNTVYNFHGCYWHGCEQCYPDQTTELAKVETDTMFARREVTEATATKIRFHGYNLIEIWECQFRNFLKRSQQAREFLNNHAVLENIPLNPRDCFFGGRTNAVKLYHKAAPDEKIRYLDVCSLYPFSNKYGKYPVGHPKIYIGDEDCRRLSLHTVEGIIKCTILPPTNLYHPVLPVKMHGKLMFILCRTCSESLNQAACNHTEDERKFNGTYVADELRKAIEMGYKVLELQEIWGYEVTQYNRQTKSGGLFAEYVDNFLKMKQECSDYPNWCVDNQSKEQYIQNYLVKEGVSLDKDKICSNPGLRYIAKLNLNSFWGKFAQRENLVQTSIISDPFEFFKMLTDPSVEVQSLIPIDEKVIVVNWKRPDEGVHPLNTVNVVLAAYTTAIARLELYKYLEKLGRRVLYFDTDSVIFTENPGEWNPPIGDYLGDMTDEISDYGPGSYITEFVSGGPKNYAFKIFLPKDQKETVVCKVKGITLNYQNSKVVNFDRLKGMVLNELEKTYVVTDRKISRTATYDVISKPERKIYQLQYTKRRRIEDSYDTLPFGFRA